METISPTPFGARGFSSSVAPEVPEPSERNFRPAAWTRSATDRTSTILPPVTSSSLVSWLASPVENEPVGFTPGQYIALPRMPLRAG